MQELIVFDSMHLQKISIKNETSLNDLKMWEKNSNKATKSWKILRFLKVRKFWSPKMSIFIMSVDVARKKK